ncbi:MAG: 2-oxo acid dehydrogenase subunit E2, partial [Oscillospiraceae bacterium]
MQPTEKKKNRKDRKDAWFISGLDPMHVFMPYLLPERTANEAVLAEMFELAALDAYIAKKNADNPEFKYTFFHAICAAIAKTMALRPRMNSFIAGHRYYEKKEISLSFVVKREFRDESDEALAIVRVDKNAEESALSQVYGQVKHFVTKVRKEQATDGATDVMATLAGFPRFAIKFFVWAINRMEYHGVLPSSLLDDDPYHCSAFIANLGSIKMNADYHHLTNWGTNSFFCVVGEKGKHPYYNADGSCELREALKLSFTIDERVADGVYFAKSIRILRRLLSE